MRFQPVPVEKNIKRNNKITMWIILSVLILLIIIGIVKFFPWGIFQMKHHNTKVVNDMDKAGQVNIDYSLIPPEDETAKDTTAERNRSLIKEMTPIVKKAQKDPNIQNILLMGLDGNDYKRRNHSDSMILVSINNKTGAIKMVSFMRDTKVKLPNWSNYAKLTDAYAFGGPGNTVNAINYLYDLDIQKYIIVDFFNFSRVVDTAGGVEINVKEKEIKEIPGIKNAGIQKLTGEQAFAYARIRKVDSDWVRTSRQRNVLVSLLDKFQQTDLIKKRNIINCMMTLCTTNISLPDMINLGINTIKNINSTSITQYTCPNPKKIDDLYKEVGSYIVVDFDKQTAELNDFLYNSENTASQSSVSGKSSSGASSSKSKSSYAASSRQQRPNTSHTSDIISTIFG